MSSSRTAIARSSLALRILRYAAFLGAVGYLGFSYSSGFIALPGDVTFGVAPFDPGKPGVTTFIYSVLPPASPGTPMPDGPVGFILKRQPGAEASGTPGAELQVQKFVLNRSVGATAPGAPGSNESFIELSGDGANVSITRSGTGDDAKGHITIRQNGKTIERDFTGTTLPDDVLKALPEKLKTKLVDMLKRPPQAGVVLFPPATGFAAPLPSTGGVAMAPGGAVQTLTLSGPALLQQQLHGHTALRATLVGVTIALVILAIVQLERLLAHFQQAELFSTRNSGLLRNIGILLIAIAFVQAASTPLPAILAKALHPVLIGALGPHLFLVFAGLGLCLIAQVMAEASRLEDEAAHTV